MKLHIAAWLADMIVSRLLSQRTLTPVTGRTAATDFLFAFEQQYT
jgi:hypothetical protein